MPITIRAQIWFSAFALLVLILHEIRSDPVIVWNGELPKKPVFPKVASSTFMGSVTDLLKKNMMVAFTEKTLSMEQLRSRNTAGESIFQYLKLVTPSFYANVESPCKALNESSVTKTTATLKSDGTTEPAVECKPGEIKLIEFADDALTEHEDAMKAFAANLTCEVVYLYTEKAKPVDGLGSENKTENENLDGILLTDKFAFYVGEISLKTGKDKKKLTPSKLAVSGDSTKLTGQLTTSDGEMTIHIDIVNDYYTVKSIQFKSVTYRAFYVEAPSDHSYYCGKLELTIGTNTLSFSRLQFQGIKNASEVKEFKFKEAWYCVQYFTPAILSGLFVMVFVISITMCGITWIMDIRATDRFEDPGGPVLQINASD